MNREFGTYRFVTLTFGTQQHAIDMPKDITHEERKAFAKELYEAIAQEKLPNPQSVTEQSKNQPPQQKGKLEGFVQRLTIERPYIPDVTGVEFPHLDNGWEFKKDEIPGAEPMVMVRIESKYKVESQRSRPVPGSGVDR